MTSTVAIYANPPQVVIGDEPVYTVTIENGFNTVELALSRMVIAIAGAGAPGVPGTPGVAGTDGVGVPAGGTAGQVLTKATGTDYDTEWADQEGAGDHTELLNIGTNTHAQIDTALNRLASTSGANTGDQDLSTLQGHVAVVAGNPHGVTQTHVGLGNVDNTTDANKPVSTAQQTALNGKEPVLGNPDTDGMVLASTTTGVRSWVVASGGSLAKAIGSDITTGTDDAKYVTAKALADAGNVMATSVQTLTNKQIYLPDGQGLNYTLTTSIATDNLTVALKTFTGTDPAAADVSIFSIGAAMLNVSAALSVAVNASMGDVFGWDAGKIQGNDAALFVYLINNNGTPQIGVSPSPMLRTVATNYYSNGAQTGSAGHTNIVMSGTRDTNNLCRVVGLINVNQLDNNNWQAPTTALTINSPVFETDWYSWSPAYAGFSTNPTSTSRYKILRGDVIVEERESAAGTSNTTSFTMTLPIVPMNITLGLWTGILTQIVDNDVVASATGQVYTTNNAITLNLQKTVGTNASWTASGGKRASFNNYRYRVS